MITITTKNPQNPHKVEVAEDLLPGLRETIGPDHEIYHAIRRFSPNGRSIPSSRHALAMIENRGKNLERDNPGAWRIRELQYGHSYEKGMFRHRGRWTRKCDEGIWFWVNDQGQYPNYDNAESYEQASQA